MKKLEAEKTEEIEEPAKTNDGDELWRELRRRILMRVWFPERKEGDV